MWLIVIRVTKSKMRRCQMIFLEFSLAEYPAPQYVWNAAHSGFIFSENEHPVTKFTANVC